MPELGDAYLDESRPCALCKHPGRKYHIDARGIPWCKLCQAPCEYVDTLDHSGHACQLQVHRYGACDGSCHGCSCHHDPATDKAKRMDARYRGIDL